MLATSCCFPERLEGRGRVAEVSPEEGHGLVTLRAHQGLGYTVRLQVGLTPKTSLQYYLPPRMCPAPHPDNLSCLGFSTVPAPEPHQVPQWPEEMEKEKKSDKASRTLL